MWLPEATERIMKRGNPKAHESERKEMAEMMKVHESKKMDKHDKAMKKGMKMPMKKGY
jgi:hypothetical protein